MAVITPIVIAGLSAAYGAYSSGRAKKKAIKADKDAQAALANRPDYQDSAASKEQLADARSKNGAISPAILQAYQMAQQQQANQQAFAQRNASSGAQALASGAEAQAQTQGILPQLAGQQDQFNQQNRGLFYDALGGMDAQHQRRYQSQLGRSADLFNFHLGQVGAANADKAAGWAMAANGLATAASSAGNMKFGNNKTTPGNSYMSGYSAAGRNTGFVSPYSNNYRLQNSFLGY